MKLVSKTEHRVIEVEYVLDTTKGQIFYKEWQDERGRVIDAAMRDKDGFEIYDAALFEEIEEYVDTLD